MRSYLVLLAVIAGVTPAAAQGQLPDGAKDGDTTTARYLEALAPDSPADVAPEPGAMALLATGLVGLMGASIQQRRKNRKQ
jgi:hypothetical protein